MNTKQLYLFILVGIFFGLMVGSIIFSSNRTLRTYEDIIFHKDSLLKEADGAYSKLVDDHNTTKRSLRNAIKSNETLDSILRVNKEKALMYEKLAITFKSQLDTFKIKVDTVEVGDTVYVHKSFRLAYPNTTDWFISVSGVIDRDRMIHRWDFGTLPLDITLTETEDGLWKRRIVGPEWIQISDLTINSLPKEDLVPEPKVRFMVGIGGQMNLTSFSPTISGGAILNNWALTGNLGINSYGFTAYRLLGKKK